MHIHTLELLGSASRGDFKTVQQLLDRGVPYDAASPGGFTALHAACMSGHGDVLKLLLQHDQRHGQYHHRHVQQEGPWSRASLESHLPRCVAAAASMGHASILRSITAFADIKYLDLQYWKPLHAAAAGGHSEAAQLLLQQYRMAVNKRCGKGYTPLHMAASTGQAQMVMLLLQAGADVHAKAPGSRTPLHFAASAGRHEVVQLLLQAGADVDVRTASNMTPLHCAASQDAVEVMQLLLQAGAVVEASSGRTTNCIRPLHCAALAGVVEAAKLLLRYGADINAAMNGGPTALTLALMKRHTAVVQLLLNKGARVSEDTLLYAAARAAPEDVLLVVAALGPAADAAMLSNASKEAAVASCMENAAVLLKQLCLVDPAAVKGVMSWLQQPARAAAACVARWLAETRSLAEQQQRLDQQQRSIAAERLAVQQLVVAAAGTQQRVAAERKALEQRANDVASVHVEQLSGSEHAGNS